MKSVIYYFSGTGNSLKVAKDVAEEIKDTKIIKICENNIEQQDSMSYDKIGIVFPVYYAGMPLLVKRFVKELKIAKETYVFSIVTFGRSADASISQVEDLLRQKGVKLSAGFMVKMPGNYQLMYPPFSEIKQRECFENERQTTLEIARSINNNEVVKSAGKKVAVKVGDMLQNILFKPYDKDINFWVDEKCNGCGTCEKICPSNNININNGKPIWEHKCEQCLACMQWCPQKSIQYKKATMNRGRYHHPEIKVSELFNK